ncbi:MAG: hypothetical protein R2799_10620 [Crocinitomicaceae bacterium]
MSGFFIFSSCHYDSDANEYVAKVYNEKLYKEDIPRDIIEDETKLELYIDQWIERQILYYKARTEPRIDQNEIQRQVDDFKKDLYYYYLEELLLYDEIDTHVTQKEIQSYYNTHKEEFLLKDFLVKVLYLKVTVDAPELDKMKRSYLLKNAKDIEDVIQYAKIYSSNFYYDEDNWIYFDDILKEVPLKDVAIERFITQKKKLYFDDGYHVYFLNVLDYKLKDGLSPLNFERENIRKKILNIRQKELRKKIKESIIQKEYEKGNVTIR